ncbi:hypothetical protein FHS23_002839 [Prauserella isguenensis]|uniref:Uncharacterized protein n=1 Tax=Prauserella isguenensis TaxID=1470180 RepID=A0A839S460_9PSEU|nr:hypothetical protein [Prauserella isguenensis]
MPPPVRSGPAVSQVPEPVLPPQGPVLRPQGPVSSIQGLGVSIPGTMNRHPGRCGRRRVGTAPSVDMAM